MTHGEVQRWGAFLAAHLRACPPCWEAIAIARDPGEVTVRIRTRDMCAEGAQLMRVGPYGSSESRPQ